MAYVKVFPGITEALRYFDESLILCPAGPGRTQGCHTGGHVQPGEYWRLGYL